MHSSVATCACFILSPFRLRLACVFVCAHVWRGIGFDIESICDYWVNYMHLPACWRLYLENFCSALVLGKKNLRTIVEWLGRFCVCGACLGFGMRRQIQKTWQKGIAISNKRCLKGKRMSRAEWNTADRIWWWRRYFMCVFSSRKCIVWTAPEYAIYVCVCVCMLHFGFVRRMPMIWCLFSSPHILQHNFSSYFVCFYNT